MIVVEFVTPDAKAVEWLFAATLALVYGNNIVHKMFASALAKPRLNAVIESGTGAKRRHVGS